MTKNFLLDKYLWNFKTKNGMKSTKGPFHILHPLLCAGVLGCVPVPVLLVFTAWCRARGPAAPPPVLDVCFPFNIIGAFIE